MKLSFQSVFVKSGLILIVLICFGSCAVHNYFPFICFERACVNQQLSLKGFKKRMKGKIAVMKRKKNKKKPLDSRAGLEFLSPRDSAATMKGINIDYYRYQVFFRVNRCVNCFDSTVVEHTSEHHTLIETDLSRLIYMMDTIRLKNILMVYIRSFRHDQRDTYYEHRENHRKKDLIRVLKNNGVPAQRIKTLQDSQTLPKL